MKICRRLWLHTHWLAGFGRLLPTFLLLELIGTGLCFGQANTLWKEGYETDDFWESWHVEGGVWAAGVPKSGPGAAFAGTRCAATVLDGDYPPGANARLVRDRVFIVPEASQHPRLRFWHWFQGAAGASHEVEIKVGTASWQPIAAASGWESDDWARALIDLSPFSGQPVQIAFHFQSEAGAETAAGWYVDEVSVETGPVGTDLINSPEGFESGLGNWSVDHGLWEVGLPTVGPERAFAGTACAGTVLGDNYPPGADSRLISPELVVPSATEIPRLRFWHWFAVWPGDFGQVEISVNGGAWQPLSLPFDYNGAVWTRPSFDLRPYAGQSVQIAFHFYSGLEGDVAKGWYIDEVVVETGATDWNPLEKPEGFESGLGNWVVDRGTWEVGNPGQGPKQALAGVNCAGTVLAGFYIQSTDSRLISPEFVVPAAAEQPRLRFWQWLRNQPEDPATVEIRVVGGDWKPLSDAIVANDGTWARPFYALGTYAGQRVQIAFHFQSNNDSNLAEGWFIDEVAVETGPESGLVNTPKDFEDGLGDWVVDRGTWEVGTPDEWPEQTQSGSRCAGTILGGAYGQGIDSRLITPALTVPVAVENPRLRFWHTFSTWPGDAGTVEISVAGGPWQALGAPFSGNSVVWTRPWFDLRPFAGQSVRIAFHFQSDNDDRVGRGWYVDDVVVETGAVDLAALNQNEGFEAGLGNWYVENGTWEVGVPVFGLGPAYKGTNCAATVLRANGGRYFPNTDSRLVSPEFTVPCAEAGPRLRFAQRYELAAGDEGSVEIRLVGGAWQRVLEPITGSSREWIFAFYDLSPYAGRRIQVGFRFRSNEDAEVGGGWDIDEVKIQATILQAPDSLTIAEGELLSYSFFTPCQNLRFSLGAGAPEGVSIDPALGILLWVPSEVQGPGIYPIQICAAPAERPQETIDCASMKVTVLESNTVPVLAPIAAQIIAAGVPLQFAVSAYDVDRPAQRLTFSLDQGAPLGATIDPLTGAFRWTPTPTQATAQHTVTVRVTDNGDPPLSATTSFTASPQGPISAVRLEVARLTLELVTITVSGGVAGSLYHLESTTEFSGQSGAADWTVIQSFWKGEGDYSQTNHSTLNPARFYRVRRAP